MVERIPAYEGRDPYIFVSYAHLNSEKVMPVIASLFEDKYRVWYDEGIAPGSEWPKNIEDHLRAAACVLVFVSRESLASPNCENEVAHAGSDHRLVLQFALGDDPHPSLAGCGIVRDYTALKECLEPTLIGDGKTGYQRGVEKAKKGNFWTGIIAFAAVLILALVLGIYGLNDGWFDQFLPGLSAAEPVEQVKEELVQTDANVITHGILQQTNADLTEEISFESEQTKELLYNTIGFENWGQPTPLTYENLTTCFADEFWLENPNDEVLTYMQYFPELKRLRINGGSLTTLEPLLSCAQLETVYVSYSVFPVEIPANAPFTVEFMY